MSKANSGLYKGTSGAISYYAGNVSYMGSDDKFLKFIQRRTDIDPNGYFDVIAHGDSNHIEIVHNGKIYNLSHRNLRRVLLATPKYSKGQPIRLLSCNTGNGSTSFAQNLANKLNVPVMAPNKYSFVSATGRHFVAGSKDGGKTPDYTDMGKYITFYPIRRKKIMENNKNICEVCGKELKVKIRGHNAISYCDEHGEMLVSTYFNEYEADHTKYDIILLTNNECSINNIKLISKITNTNSVNAKRLLTSQKEECIYKNYTSDFNVGSALDIKEIAMKLKEANIRFTINPEFKHKL